MKILNLLPILFILASCQQADDISEAVKTDEVKSEIAPPKAIKIVKSAITSSNDFSMIVDQPYDIIESTETCNEPIVMEFFAYQCPHCYTLEKFAEEWKTKNAGKVKFQAIPTHLGHKEFGAFLIVHQAAKNLNLLDQAIPMLFKRLHEDKKSFSSPEEAVEFLVSVGANKEEAEKTINNDEKIKTGMDENFRLLTQYKIAGVPTILVNHRYQFNVTKAGGYEKVFKVVEETLKLPSNCSSQ